MSSIKLNHTRKPGFSKNNKNKQKSIFDKIVDNLNILLCEPTQKINLSIVDKSTITINILNYTYINLLPNDINQLIINSLNYNLSDITNFLTILNNPFDLNWRLIYEYDFGVNENVIDYMDDYISYSEYIDFKKKYYKSIIRTNFNHHQIRELSLKLTNFPLEVCNFIGLVKLNLTNSYIVELPIEFNNLINLTDLNLCRNLLVKFRYCLVNLKKLNVGYNSLGYHLSLGELISLEKLDISFNGIVRLDESILGLSKLKKMTISRPFANNLNNIVNELLIKGVNVIQL